MKLAVIFNERKFSGKLTKFWTGCYAYHVGWVGEKRNRFYDMNLIRRRTLWPHYSDETSIMLHDFPQVTREYLESQLETDESTYGWKDYLMFSLRPIYHLFGRSTRNTGGVICSEMINIDLWNCGVETPWNPKDAPPSPCDLYKWINN